jgi:hypothetical protein
MAPKIGRDGALMRNLTLKVLFWQTHFFKAYNTLIIDDYSPPRPVVLLVLLLLCSDCTEEDERRRCRHRRRWILYDGPRYTEEEKSETWAVRLGINPPPIAQGAERWDGDA